MSEPAAIAHGRNDDIEVLRAAAVLLTLICHINTLLSWRGPHIQSLEYLSFWGGVDLFFCISGYVIAGTLLRQQASGTFRALAVPFYIRRIYRIWPAAFLWLLLPLLAAQFFNHSGVFGHLHSVSPATLAAALQVENVYASLCGHSPEMPCGQADVYWSLSLEEQFYLAFPILLFLLSRASLKRTLLVLAVVQIFWPRPYESLVWSLRTDAISLGVLLAVLQAEGSWLPRNSFMQRHAGLLGWSAAGLLLLLALVSVLPALGINVGLLALISAGLLWIASANAGLILPWARLRPLLLWVGSRSFAIYLVHNPCFRATREIFYRLDLLAPANTFSWLMLLTAVALIVLCAEATFRLVETPLRLYGRDLARRWEAGQREAVRTMPLKNAGSPSALS
jgi:peptidoglycan/LPS O-acetylase OafA/YrhL